MDIIEMIKKRCLQSVAGIFKETRRKSKGQIIGKKGDQFVYVHRGATVLAVAHCDTVQQGKEFDWANLKGEDTIVCPRLDDRLGVFVVLDLLPMLNIKTDVLLTENEEKGRSTADGFHLKSGVVPWNWIVEFDRRGEDVVTYDYDPPPVLKEYFEIGIGSTSDICKLYHLERFAFNVGVGYHNEHADWAYCVWSEFKRNMQRFVRFYSDYKDIKFDFKRKYASYNSKYYYNKFDEFGFGDYWDSWPVYRGDKPINEVLSVPKGLSVKADEKTNETTAPKKETPKKEENWKNLRNYILP